MSILSRKRSRPSIEMHAQASFRRGVQANAWFDDLKQGRTREEPKRDRVIARIGTPSERVNPAR